jgi:hypothetical protein
MKVESLETLPFTKLAEGKPEVKRSATGITVTLGGVLITFDQSDLPLLTQALAPKAKR